MRLGSRGNRLRGERICAELGSVQLKMGRQVNFFLLPSDLALVEQALRLTGPVVFLPEVVAEPRIETLSSIQLPEERMGKERLRVHVTRPDFLSKIRLRHIPAQGYFIVEPGSPVIELDRNFFDGQRVRHGRMYFYTGPNIDPEFVRWGDKVLRAVRKVLVRSTESKTEYFGPAAIEWMKRTHAKAQPGVAVFARGNRR